MDWSRIASTTLSMLAAGAVIGWFMRSSYKSPEVEGEAIQLRYAKVMRVFMMIFGWIFAIAALGMVIAVILGAADEKLTRISWGCVPIFALLGFATLFEVRVHLNADDEGIRGQTAFRGYREVRWDELAMVYYSGSLNTFKMVDRSGNCIRMSRYLVGHALIVELMGNQLPESVVGKAIKNYHNAVKAGF